MDNSKRNTTATIIIIAVLVVAVILSVTLWTRNNRTNNNTANNLNTANNDNTVNDTNVANNDTGINNTGNNNAGISDRGINNTGINNNNTNQGAVKTGMSADICKTDFNFKSAKKSKILADYKKYCNTKSSCVTTPNNARVAGDTNTTPSTNTSYDSYIKQVVNLVNKERAKQGLKSLKKRKDVEPASAIRSKELVTKFSHTRPNGKRGLDIIKEYKISCKMSGENIAYGYPTAAKVVKAWMSSPGHRANILNKGYTGIGVGVYKKGSTLYWTQIFVG